MADQNPLKQGKSVPGARIVIESPTVALRERPAYVFIVAWNFAPIAGEAIRKSNV